MWGVCHNAPSPSKTVKEAMIVKKNYLTSQFFLVESEGKVYLSRGVGRLYDIGRILTFKSHRDPIFNISSRFYPLNNNLTPSSSILVSLRRKLKEHIIHLEKKYQSLESWLKVIFLGEKDSLHPRVLKSFEFLGIFHLLVISGFHISSFGFFVTQVLLFVCNIFYALLLLSPGIFECLKKLSYLVGSLFVFCYALVLYMPQPVQRACLAYLVFTYLGLFSRKIPVQERLGIILTSQVLIFPIGFLQLSSVLSWLSYLIIITQTRSDGLPYLFKVLLCQAFLLVVTGCLLGKLSLLGFFTNIIVVPFFLVVYWSAVFLLAEAYLPSFLVSISVSTQEFFLKVVNNLYFQTKNIPWIFLDMLEHHFLWRILLAVCAMLIFLYIINKNLSVKKYDKGKADERRALERSESIDC